MLQVRLFQPFPVAELVAALPSTVRSIAVLDRTKERRKFRRIPPEALGQLLGAAK